MVNVLKKIVSDPSVLRELSINTQRYTPTSFDVEIQAIIDRLLKQQVTYIDRANRNNRENGN